MYCKKVLYVSVILCLFAVSRRPQLEDIGGFEEEAAKMCHKTIASKDESRVKNKVQKKRNLPLFSSRMNESINHDSS